MQTYVTAAGYSHWHIVRPETALDAGEVTSVCGEVFPAPSADPTSRRLAGVPDGQPLCDWCAGGHSKLGDVGHVYDADSYKAGAASERRKLAARLRALLARVPTRPDMVLDRLVWELANELEPRDAGQ
ncbi:MAG: hypothetical protein ACOYD1_12740 [Candidatus Nanopelagicales bacterium]